MSKRSVYYGLHCLHCHKAVAVGRAAFASTYYVIPGKTWLKTQSMRAILEFLPSEFSEEMRIRVLYHRACIEGILRHAPIDYAIEIAEFEQYRAELADRLGVDEAV